MSVVMLESGLRPSGLAFLDVAVRGLARLRTLTRRMSAVRATFEEEAAVDLSVNIDRLSTQRDWLVLSLTVESLTSMTGAPSPELLARIAATYRRAGRARRRAARPRA